MTCEQAREQLPELILATLNKNQQQELQNHLNICENCRREYSELQTTLTSLAATQNLAAPAGLKNRIMQAAQQTTVRQFGVQTQNTNHTKKSNPILRLLPLVASLGLAAALAAFFLRPSNITSGETTVVASTATGGAVYARSGKTTQNIVVVNENGTKQNIFMASSKPAWFTEAKSQGDYTYLLDAGNSRMVIVNHVQAKLVTTRKLLAGAAGLDVSGNTVLVKGAACGILQVFRNAMNSANYQSFQIAPEQNMGQAEFMDAVLMQGNRTFVTHHATGELTIMDNRTHLVLKKLKIGKNPVALAAHGQDILVLDYQGMLYRMNANTYLQKPPVVLGGHADKIAINGNTIALSDRAGFVTLLDATTMHRSKQKVFVHAMDVNAMPDGHWLLASSTGVSVLDDQLDVMKQL